MPSDRKQINVRVDEEIELLLPALCRAVGEALGLTITNTDLFRMGVNELRRKYLPNWVPPSAGEQTAPKKKGKK